MFSAILILMIMPFVDLGRNRGLQFRPLSKIAFFVFVANFLILMQLGAKHVESPFIEFGQISTVLYFSYFLVIMPLISLLENSFVDLRLERSESSSIKVSQVHNVESKTEYSNSSLVPRISRRSFSSTAANRTRSTSERYLEKSKKIEESYRDAQEKLEELSEDVLGSDFEATEDTTLYRAVTQARGVIDYIVSNGESTRERLGLAPGTHEYHRDIENDIKQFTYEAGRVVGQVQQAEFIDSSVDIPGLKRDLEGLQADLKDVQSDPGRYPDPSDTGSGPSNAGPSNEGGSSDVGPSNEGGSSSQVGSSNNPTNLERNSGSFLDFTGRTGDDTPVDLTDFLDVVFGHMYIYFEIYTPESLSQLIRAFAEAFLFII